MTFMPGVANKLLPNASRTRMSSHDIICIHTMVGSLAGTDSYFRNGTGVNSHFGTGAYGEIWQWVDTDYRSGANLNGNHRVISIENADLGPGFAAWNTNDPGQVPAFTPQQLEANAQIVAWACKTYDIPCELIPDTKPGRRGIGYHRQGVPGYMAAGAEKWSNATGKVCPGSRRIAQIPKIILRAREILAGDEGDNELNTIQAVQLQHAVQHASENRRMLGVLLGWNAPATEGERNALVRIYGEGNVPEVDEDALAVALVARLPKLDLTKLSDEDVERIADAAASRIGKKLVDEATDPQ